MPLLINGKVTEDKWVALDEQAFAEDPSSVIAAIAASNSAVIYPISSYLAHRDVLKAQSQKIGLVVTGDDELSELTELLDEVSLIAIEFPVLRDGRGFSIARNIVRRGFKGEVRAVGDVGFDRLDNMHRSGFNAYQVEDADGAAIFAKAMEEISVNYQPTHQR